MQQTSLLAFSEIQPELGERQRQVFLFIKEKKGCNNLMISQGLGIAINSVTGRTKELVDQGLVESMGKAHCPITGKQTLFWRVK